MKPIKGYRVFIASPAKLDRFRKSFVDTLNKYNEHHGIADGMAYLPVGWDFNIPGGINRAQSEINLALADCDYFVLVLADRWGTPTGRLKPNGEPFRSGVEEEFYEAWNLYNDGEKDMKNMLVLFKDLPRKTLHSTDPQVQAVHQFRRELDAMSMIYYKRFKDQRTFEYELESAISKWHNDGHVKARVDNVGAEHPSERFQHPWLNGGLVRRILCTEPPETWTEIEKAWKVYESEGLDYGVSELLALGWHDLPVRLELARMYGLGGMTEKAKQIASDCLDPVEQPSLPPHQRMAAALTYADLLLAYGEAAQALPFYQEQLDLIPNAGQAVIHTEVCCRVGRTLRKLAEEWDDDEMTRRSEKAPSKGPNPHWVRAYKVYQKAKQMVERDADIPAFLRSTAYYGLGHVHYGLKEYASAEDLFRIVLAMEKKPGASRNVKLRATRSLAWSKIMSDNRYPTLRLDITKLLLDANALADDLNNQYEKILLLEAEALIEIYQLEGGVGDYRRAIAIYEVAKHRALEHGYLRRAGRIQKNIDNLRGNRDFED